MGEESTTHPNRTERLLMAVALRGTSPETVRVGRITANGIPVLRQALHWAGLWNPATKTSLFSADYNAVVNDWYSTLLGLCRAPAPLVDGFGFDLREGRPACYATYAAFGLTEDGWRAVRTLFEQFPDLQESVDPTDVPES